MFSSSIVCLLFGVAIGNAIGSTCPDWVPFNGSSYCFNDNEQSWSNATKTCQDFGGGLAVPNFKEEQEFIHKMYKEQIEYDWHNALKKIHGLWIDCSFLDGNWVHEDGTLCEYTFWAERDMGSGSCAVIFRSITVLLGQWKYDTCNNVQFSICESALKNATPNRHQPLATVCLQADTNGRFASHCLTGHVIKELSIKGVVACGSACRDEPRCRSFNVRLGRSSKEQICQLNDVTREEADKEDIEMDNSCYYFNN